MSAPTSQWQFTAFSKKLRRDRFDCGNRELNEYIKAYAGQDSRRNLSRVYVAVPVEDPTTIIGYYTLSASSALFSSFPPELGDRLPKYPIPIALIGRLAVDQNYQKLGLGQQLVLHALKMTLKVNISLAIHALVVEAKDNAAKRFYQKFDFIPFRDNPERLFLPIKTIQDVYK